MRNVLLKLLNVISVLIIIASMAALLTVVLAKPGQAPNFFGYSLFRVMTGSMEPTIPTNSLIVVKRTPAEDLAEGDVITFYSRDPSLLGEPNTHRIIRFEEEDGKRQIYTKGDANNIEDRYPAKDEDVIGKVIYSSPGLGKFVRLVSNPVIFIPVIVLPLLWMLGRSVYDSIVAAKKLAKEEEEAAVRAALAEIREKRKGGAGKDGEEGKTPGENKPEGEEAGKSEHEGEKGKKGEGKAKGASAATGNGRVAAGSGSTGSESSQAVADGRMTETDNAGKALAKGATRWEALPVQTAATNPGSQENWRRRYGVQYRNAKRKQLRRGNRNR